MHGIAAITGNMHRSLRYFVLIEHITSNFRLEWRLTYGFKNTFPMGVALLLRWCLSKAVRYCLNNTWIRYFRSTSVLLNIEILTQQYYTSIIEKLVLNGVTILPLWLNNHYTTSGTLATISQTLVGLKNNARDLIPW